VDASQLVQRFLKDAGIEVELKLLSRWRVYGDDVQGKYEGMVYAPVLALGTQMARRIDTSPTSRSTGAMSTTLTLTALLKEQRTHQ
jgi:hypothetical protein